MTIKKLFPTQTWNPGTFPPWLLSSPLRSGRTNLAPLPHDNPSTPWPFEDSPGNSTDPLLPKMNMSSFICSSLDIFFNPLCLLLGMCTSVSVSLNGSAAKTAPQEWANKAAGSPRQEGPWAGVPALSEIRLCKTSSLEEHSSLSCWKESGCYLDQSITCD